MSEYDELVKQLNIVSMERELEVFHRLARAAAGAIVDIRNRAEKAVADVERLKAIGFKILSKLDHPTASVTQWDSDELRAVLEAKP